MNLPKFELPKPRSLIHIIIGGAICFLMMFLLAGFTQRGFEATLNYFGNLGVLIFDEAVNAFDIVLFGVAYLPSGFLGGLYTGYKVKEEDLRVVLALTGISGFVILTLIGYFSGSLSALTVDFTKDILLPLSGSIIGAYLGGYTINWPSAGGEIREEVERITLDLGK